MKKIKIISSGVNNSYDRLEATTKDKSGNLSTLKQDGSFIKGRMPMPDEMGLVWNFGLTSKEPMGKGLTRLFAEIHVPEEGVDVMENEEQRKHFRKMNGLYEHIMGHKDVMVYEYNNGQRGAQLNTNYTGNHLKYFEAIDESAKAFKAFENARLVTKYSQIVDSIFDRDVKGDGELLELCYLMGVHKPLQNPKEINYNLLISKLNLNPENFKLIYEDVDRDMLAVINKSKRMTGDNGLPYITQNTNNLCYFNGVAIGTHDDELKLYFKRNIEEFAYLKRVTGGGKKEVKKVAIEKPEVTPKPYTAQELPNLPDQANNKFERKAKDINREIGMVLGLIKGAEGRGTPADSFKQRLVSFREKLPEDMQVYFDKELVRKSTEKGVAVAL